MKRTVPNPFSHDFLKGGPGSGNFGHAGRPGMRGGSSDDGGSSTAKNPPGTTKKTRSFLAYGSKETAERLAEKLRDDGYKVEVVLISDDEKEYARQNGIIEDYKVRGYIASNWWIRTGSAKYGVKRGVAPDINPQTRLD